MKRALPLFAFLLLSFTISAQLYFPPIGSSDWDTISTDELNWCSDSLAALNQFLDDKNTKAFIVLKDGKIAVEWYYDDFVQDSLWYWASAGKTMMATLTGIAQEEGLLDINDPTSDYLGNWTSCDTVDEQQISIWNQLTMTSGLDYNVPNVDCTDDTCLTCLNTPGSEWFYHNAPYTFLREVVESASGQNINVFYYTRLANKIGMGGSFIRSDYNNLLVTKPRDMARFGLLMLNKGNWDGTSVLGDTTYFNQMTTPSQNINNSYGYLWWLNGQADYRLPGTTITFTGLLIPTAPADMFSGLGKNDQKVYVVPSENMVVIRMGNDADPSQPLALTSFDEQLWQKISMLENCPVSIANELDEVELNIHPNPAQHYIEINSPVKVKQITLYSILGQPIRKGVSATLPLTGISSGIYMAIVELENGQTVQRQIIKN